MSPRVCHCLKCAKNAHKNCHRWITNDRPTIILNCPYWEAPEPPEGRKGKCPAGK